MKHKIFIGDIKQCIYIGFAGNMLGAEHDKPYKQNAILVELAPSKYIELEDLLVGKKERKNLETKILTPYAKKVGDLFVDEFSLTDIRELIELKDKQNQKRK